MTWLGSSRPHPLWRWTTNWLLCSVMLASPALAAAKSAADYFVHSLPGQPEGPLLKMHAGHIEVDPAHNGNLFFWHFQNRHIDKRQRTVIWLNGGPGCSSMDGALMEVGPYRVKADSTLAYNEGSWDEFANLLFVDNPVGTGFSYVDTNSYLHELQEMADQFVIFLEKWFAVFPEYENDEIYIAGESYAGQHIPYIAKTILERNKKNPGRLWNVSGLIIGNGWIAPVEQYNAYLTYAYKEGIISGGTDSARRVEAKQSACLSALERIDGNGLVNVPICEAVLTSILEESRKGNKCVNMYDIRLTDEYPSCGMRWPPDLENVTPYLRQRNVTDALHVTPGKSTGWTECVGKVGEFFKARNSRPSVDLLPGMLEEGVRILLFSGDRDLICNHYGTEDFVHNMKWGGGTGFELSPGVWAPRHDWTFQGEAAGIYQEARNLTYLLFYNASHMVPFDYSRRSREMLDQFMGVNITSIGGIPSDSRIDGTKTNPTSVGGHGDGTAEDKEKVKEATWAAYYKSGEVALVVVIIGAGIWGFFIWRARQKQRRAGYRGIYPNGDASDSAFVLPRYRHKREVTGDLEAGDFDEAELDNLRTMDGSPSAPKPREGDDYSIGGESDDDHEKTASREPRSILKKPSEADR